MVGDNPRNSERWKLHGTQAEYWRSDNPFIIGWYRLGEDEYPIGGTVGEPERTDSGPRHHHLATNQSPDTYIVHVSGVAPWSSSGVMFDGTWPETGANRALRLDSDYYRDRTDFSTLGYYGVGNAANSGVTIMGWARIPHSAVNPTTPRRLWANIEGSTSSNDGEWAVDFRVDTRILEFTYNSFGTSSTPAGAVHTVDSSDDPDGTIPPDEPFFFACQVNKGNPISSNLVGEGSGILRIFLGTTVSGLHEVGALPIVVPSTNFWRGDNTMHGNTNFPYTMGADPVSARGNTSSRSLPPSSIIDEFIVIGDGNLDVDRMIHYMNNGITQDAQDPLSLVEGFAPELPGTDDLVAYWTFDEQGGANTSPNTPVAVNLDMTLNGVSFVDGIRGGSGIRPNSFIDSYSVETFPTDKTGLAHVIGGSGLNHLFPEHDQTWIGWVRSEGVNNRGGAVGWFSDTSNRHIAAYWNTYIFGVASIRSDQIDMGVTPSGGPSDRIASVGGISAGFNPNSARSMDNGDWHLLGIVFDITHGFIRVVYDAIDVYPMLIDNLTGSGLTKEHLISGPDNAGFVLGNIDVSSRCSYDDWAVYDRILSVPEMSGYALSGIEITPVIPPIDTSLKRTLGYWKMGEPEVFDPTNVSGLRFNDESWYRHHLTNVSGNFQQGEFLNDKLGATTAEVTASGSIAAVASVDSSANLDFSASGVWASSGFTAGCWMYLPSGDLQTQGNGSSGLVGDRIFMGVWGQDADDDQSWFLGMRDNKFLSVLKLPGLPASAVESESGVPFNTPFFAAMKAVPSGGQTVVEVFQSTEPNDPNDIQLVARDIGISSTNNLNGGGTSGFAVLGAANLEYGFPSGTRIQGPFVYAGGLSEADLTRAKVAGVEEITLASGAVSIVDPDNISHWRFDERGAQFEDRGQAQNFLKVVNLDGHQAGTDIAIHTSGVVIRDNEYYETGFNAEPSGLDLATDNKSWTFLTWVKPNASVPLIGESVIMGKGGAESGIEIFTLANSLNPVSRASGITTQSYNGSLAPGDWNHLAVVFDRDNNEYEVVVNGRYGGGHFNSLLEVPPNNSGMALGGRGDQERLPIPGGTSFSGMLDDSMLFRRALSLPEISGLAANTYNFTENAGPASGSPVGAYVSGIVLDVASGIIGAWLHGLDTVSGLTGGHVSGVSGVVDHWGGFLHGKASISGLPGGFIHGADIASGLFGCFMHGLDMASGFIGSYTYGACEGSSEFDITLNFRIVSFNDFDARLGVEKTREYNFDARLGVIQITRPPTCTLELPLIGTIGSGTPTDPYMLTVQGSGIAQNNKTIEKVRFTFSDFKGAELGTLVAGETSSGLYEATRALDTSGWYTVKIEVVDSFGYRASCARPFFLIPSGTPSGEYLNDLPGIRLTSNTTTGSTIQRVLFEHNLSGLQNTSGVLEYTDFADEQESLVNSLEMPSGNAIFTSGFRGHDYTMPGTYTPVWAVSGSWGIVSDSISIGIDYLV